MLTVLGLGVKPRIGPVMHKAYLFKGLSIRTPIIIPVKARGFINHEYRLPRVTNVPLVLGWELARLMTSSLIAIQHISCISRVPLDL